MQKNILACFSILALAILATTVYAGYTGSVGMTIDGTTQVSFTTASVAWGSGYIATGGGTCTLDTNATNTGCPTFNNVSTPLAIENIGTYDVTLELASSKNADEFIGGTGPTFKWKMIAGEAASCTGITPGSYTNVNTTSPGTLVCSTLFALSTKDLLDVHLQVVIPSDATAEAKTAIITATATKVVA